jgi:hypothetical protein
MQRKQNILFIKFNATRNTVFFLTTVDVNVAGMETYYLAGSADDYEASVAELIGDNLVNTYPNIGFVKDLRHPCEWVEFRRIICDSRGFDIPGSSALIWRKNGRLIGNANDFKSFVKEKYAIEVQIDDAKMREIQKENSENAEKQTHEDSWTPLVGTYTKSWKDGTVFEGSWKDHKPKKGTLTFSDGSSYTGPLVDSRFHGSGLRKYANGAKFRGLFTKGLKEGIGKYQDADGNEYDGHYANDLCHGKGTRKWSSGRVYSGDWRENQATGSGTETIPTSEGLQLVYRGEFLRGLRHGRGGMTYPGGETYSGEWHEGLRHGTGSMTWSGQDELAFSGLFRRDAPAHGTLSFDGGDMTAAYPGEVPRGAPCPPLPSSPFHPPAQRAAARRAPRDPHEASPTARPAPRHGNNR